MFKPVLDVAWPSPLILEVIKAKRSKNNSKNGRFFCSCADWISDNLWISSVLTFWQQQKGSRLSSSTLVCLQYETQLTIMKCRSCRKSRCVGTAEPLRWHFRHEQFITTYWIILLTACSGNWTKKAKPSSGPQRVSASDVNENNEMKTCDRSASI